MSDIRTALSRLAQSGFTPSAKPEKKGKASKVASIDTKGILPEELLTGEMTPEKLVLLIIGAEKLMNTANGHPEWRGCHWFYSGGKELFKSVFPELDDREVTERMVQAGQLHRFVNRTGPTFYLPQDWTPAKERHKAASSKATALAEAIAALRK